jgi:condensin complex subunit 3
MQIFIPVFEQISNEHKQLDEDEEMVSPAQVGGMFVDWTNPQEAV